MPVIPRFAGEQSRDELNNYMHTEFCKKLLMSFNYSHFMISILWKIIIFVRIMIKFDDSILCFGNTKHKRQYGTYNNDCL